MDSFFNGFKEMLKEQGKKKILLFMLPLLPYILLIFGAILLAMMYLVPISNFFNQIDAFSSSVQSGVSTFFEKFGNALSLRGFRVIDEEALSEKERELGKKLNGYYNDYIDHGVTIDVSLIISTIYYPLDNLYDEEKIDQMGDDLNLTEEELAEREKDQNKEIYDYYKKISSNMFELVRHSVKETISEYGCEKITSTNADGKETVDYVRGDLLSTNVTPEYDGNLKNSEVCNSTSNIKVYSYEKDDAKYDEYLKTYIPDTKVYEFPNNLAGEEREKELSKIIDRIRGMKDLYEDAFDIVRTSSVQFANLCSGGVVVIKGDQPDEQNADTGVFSLEDYVAGVITHENNYGGNNIESMKAQAIAARTYTLVLTDYCSKPIRNSTSDQTFSANASADSKRAAEETAGMVLVYDEDIFLSEYDSFYCTEVTTCPTEGFCSCEYTMEPDGSKHTVSIPASYVRFANGGHGRGMSQVAANYLQDQGYTYDQILKTFYSDGVEITTSFGNVGNENGVDGKVTVKDGVFYIPSRNEISGLAGSKGSGPGGLNIFFWNRLDAFLKGAESAGYEIGITDYWRDYNTQERCYYNPAKIDKNGNHLCAIPGTSNHGWGAAADLNYFDNRAATDWAHTNASKYFLEFTVCADYFGGVCTENWHIEPVDVKRLK